MSEDKPFTVVMLVIDPEADKIIRRHEVNFNRPRSREWMKKAQVWAFNNNYIVELSSVDIDKKYGLSEDFVLTDLIH